VTVTAKCRPYPDQGPVNAKTPKGVVDVLLGARSPRDDKLKSVPIGWLSQERRMASPPIELNHRRAHRVVLISGVAVILETKEVGIESHGRDELAAALNVDLGIRLASSAGQNESRATSGGRRGFSENESSSEHVYTMTRP
jgi:hypothetical protein